MVKICVPLKNIIFCVSNLSELVNAPLKCSNFVPGKRTTWNQVTFGPLRLSERVIKTV